MKVLMLGWEFPPHISGGLGTACRGLTRGLARRGVDVLFVVPRVRGDEDRGPVRLLGCEGFSDGPVPGPPENPYTADSNSNPSGRPDARVEPLPVSSALLPYLDAGAYRVRAARLALPAGPAAAGGASPSYAPDLPAEVSRYARAVTHLSRKEEFDLVHGHDWMTYPAAASAARARGVPLVLHVHSSEVDRSGARADPAIRAIEQRGLEEADAVICVSRYTAARLRRYYEVDPRRLRVVHNAVLLEDDGASAAPRPPRRFRDPVVLFLGRVTFQKGPGYFLEAAARVAAVDPGVKFVMAGSGDMLPEMVERAAALGLARRIHFTGFLRGPDVERAYGEADVYVMPSVSEPFGISPLEAMTRGVPVILSRQSGVSEVVTHVLKADFWDVDDLANKILSVLRRPALRGHLSSEGRIEAGRLRWEGQAEEVRGVYEELLR